VRHGIEGLYVRPIALSSREQRKGRAGRVKPGVYIDHFDGNVERAKYPTPEILRVRLDKALLQLAKAGLKMEEVEFLHQPPQSAIKQARRRMVSMECLTKQGEVTPLGDEVAAAPVSAPLGRMLVEGRKRNVLGPTMEVAAVLEAGTQVQRHEAKWRDLIGDESDSDALAHFLVFRAARKMATDEEREAAGVHVRNFHRAEDILSHLEKSLKDWAPVTGSTYDREALLLSICSGLLERVYEWSEEGYDGGDGSLRKLSDESVVEGSPWLVGVPFDLSLRSKFKDEEEERVLNLLTMVTRLQPHYLQELVPAQVEVLGYKEARYDPLADRVYMTGTLRYNGVKLHGDLKCGDDNGASDGLTEWLTEVTLEQNRWNNKVIGRQAWPAELKNLIFTNRSFLKQAGMSKRQVVQEYRKRLNGASTLFEAGNLDALLFGSGEV
jgi:hypothetical protein